MPVPTDLNTQAAVDHGFAEAPALEVADPTLEEAVDTPLPFLRITAIYAGALTTGHPDTINVDLDIEEVNAKLDADGNEPAFIRFVVRTIEALRAQRAPATEAIVFGGAIGPEQLADLQDRLAKILADRKAGAAKADRDKRYGRQGLPADVIARVLVDPPAYATGGQVREPGSGADDTVPADLSGCTSGLPYDNGGFLAPATDDTAKAGE